MRLASVVLVLGSWIGASSAQPPQGRQTPEAVFEAGVRAMERRDWVAAEILFRQAYEAEPSPRTRLNLAEALFEQDELLAARDEATAVAGGDDLLLRDAAQMLLERVEAGFAQLRLRANGLGPGKGSFRVDGEPVDAAGAILLDPGEHAVALVDGDRLLANETVTLRRGEERDLMLEPDLSPEAAVALEESGETPPILGGPRARRQRRRRLGMGIAAAIVVVGAIALGVGLGVRGNDDPGGAVDAIVFDLRP